MNFNTKIIPKLNFPIFVMVLLVAFYFFVSGSLVAQADTAICNQPNKCTVVSGNGSCSTTGTRAQTCSGFYGTAYCHSGGSVNNCGINKASCYQGDTSGCFCTVGTTVACDANGDGCMGTQTCLSNNPGGGNTLSSCANDVCAPTPVNGFCGASTNTCGAGSLSDIADGACTNNWSCVGTNGGTTASCSTAKPVVNGTWSCSGSNPVCNGASCGGTCPGAAPTCAPTPTGSWTYPSSCPTSCGQSQTTQTQVCTGGNGLCSGSASSRTCSATAPCVCVPNGSCSASTPACGNVTFGIDNCGNSCSRTGGICACTPNGTCSAPTPACGATTFGVNNCGTSCSRTGGACPTTSGTLTPPTASCVITAGLNTCNVALSWTTTNPVGTSAVTSNYPSANTTVATGNTGNNVSLAVPYASSPRSFYLYNNAALLAQSVATASCATGTAWDVASATCKTGGGGPPSAATASISATPVSIPYNTSATLTWSYANASSCTITLPGTITGYPSGSGTISTGNLTVTKTYTISCDPGSIVGNATVTVQAQPGYNLNIVSRGQGTVTTSPMGTNCGTNCLRFEANTSVQLVPTPAPGRIFIGWDGDCSGTNTCNLIMDESKSVIANFAVDPNFKEF